MAQAVARVTSRRDFLAANAGIRVATPAFVLLVRQTEFGCVRAGFTVTRKIGNAVRRNRAKRRLREVARLVLGERGEGRQQWSGQSEDQQKRARRAEPSADYIFIARPMASEPSFAQLLAYANQAVSKAGRRLGDQP